MSKQEGTRLNNSKKNAIGKRDKWTCQVCGRGDDGDKHRLEVHHRDGDHTHNEDSNLELQGRSCHERTHREGIPSIIAAIKKALGTD